MSIPQIVSIAEEYKTIIGWILVIFGWTASNMVAFKYGMKKSWHEKALAVFEEISVQIERANRLNNDINRSIGENEDQAKRISLWTEYKTVKAYISDNTPRLRYLMQAYYGTRMRITFDWVWGQLVDNDPNVYARCESSKTGLCEGIASYIEGWDGYSPNGLSIKKYNGLKWRMMKHLNSRRAKALLKHEDNRLLNENETRKH